MLRKQGKEGFTFLFEENISFSASSGKKKFEFGQNCCHF